MARALLAMVLLALLGGCSLLGLSALDVEAVGISAQQPSNVAVYLWAAHGDEPLTELSLGDFRIYENDQELSSSEIGLTLLDRTAAAEHHTLLLVDMSGSSNEQRQDIARAVAPFVARVRQAQGVTVYAFAGTATPTLVGEFPRLAGGNEPRRLPELESYLPADTSRDLHGAILEGLKQLDARLMRAQKPLRVGSLVVFTRGTDLAGRVSYDQVQTALDETRHLVFALGVGDSDDDGLSDIGRNGVVRAHAMNTIGIGFEDTATLVDANLRRYYLLSYCTPARAGRRQLRVEVTTTDREGEPIAGDVELEFNADGFGPGCDPTAPPRFVVQAPPATGGPPAPEPGSGVSVDAAPAAPSTPAPTDAEPAPDASAEGTDEIAPPPDRPGYAPE